MKKWIKLLFGRGGSDTSAVAIAIAVNADECYIFSDVDGIYTADPRKVKLAKKLDYIDYKEMSTSSTEGAQILHDRCVELAEKYNLKIITSATESNNLGTIISDNENALEENGIKNIIQNDNLVMFNISNSNKINVLNILVENHIRFGLFEIKDNNIIFTALKEVEDKIIKVFNKSSLNINQSDISKISIVGRGISNNPYIMSKIVSICDDIKDKIYNIDISAFKVSITFNTIIDHKYLNTIHHDLILNK